MVDDLAGVVTLLAADATAASGEGQLGRLVARYINLGMAIEPSGLERA